MGNKSSNERQTNTQKNSTKIIVRQITNKDIDEFIKQLGQQSTIPKDVEQAEWLKIQRQSVKQFLEEKHYVPNFKYTAKPCTNRTFLEVEFYTGYKLARVMTDDKMSSYVIALVILKIPKHRNEIVRGYDGTRIDLNTTNEYSECMTGRVIVDGVKFIGHVKHIEQTYTDFRQGKSHIVSNFDGNFRYPLGWEIVEPDFKKLGIGCRQGIHFFMSLKAVLKYAGSKGFLGELVHTPIITPAVQTVRDVDIELDELHVMDKFSYDSGDTIMRTETIRLLEEKKVEINTNRLKQVLDLYSIPRTDIERSSNPALEEKKEEPNQVIPTTNENQRSSTDIQAEIEKLFGPSYLKHNPIYPSVTNVPVGRQLQLHQAAQ